MAGWEFRDNLGTPRAEEASVPPQNTNSVFWGSRVAGNRSRDRGGQCERPWSITDKTREKAVEGKMRAAEAGRTDVRAEALRAAISFGTAEAVPLTWTQARG